MPREIIMDHISALVIEDNHYMSAIIKTMLRGFGIHRIQAVTDAADALEELQHNAYDVIILDYLLDTLDGIEFTEMLRSAKDSPNRFVPIIMLSAYSERRLIEQSRDAGVTEFLRKPISARDLYLRLAEIILNPRPFIKSATYFGPDRRRRINETYSGEERRQASLIEQLD